MSVPPLQVRTAARPDAPRVAALVNSAYRGDSSRAGWTTEADLLGGQRIDEDAIAAAIGRPACAILLHEEGGLLLGCVQLERTQDECYLGMLTVAPDRQAQGLGWAMLAAAEHWAATTWRSRAVHMTVIVQRSELIAWYERRGYARTGERRPFPYGDARFGLPRRDDLEFDVLRKSLT